MDPELAARLIHSADERIAVEDLELGARFLRHVAATLGAMSREPQIRLGGMALANGVLVHGPRHWACAVRTDDGELKVASGLKPVRAADVKSRLARGPARVAEIFALLPEVRRRLPEAKLPFQRPGVLGAMAGSIVAIQAVRRTRFSPLDPGVAGGAARARAGRRGAARHGARRVPRRRAHLDRELRARRAAHARARALRLAHDRPAARDDRGRERARRARPAAPAPARPRRRRRRLGRRGGRGLLLDGRQRAPSGRPRARPARATSSSSASSPPSPRPSSSRSRTRLCAECLRLESPADGASRRGSSASRLRSSTSRSRRCGRATTPTSTSTTPARRCSRTAATRGWSCRSSRSSRPFSAGWTRRSRSSSSAPTTGTTLTVHALYDGDEIAPWETVMTIEGDYTLFAHLETLLPGRARAPDADLDERPPRRRGGARQADPLLPGPPRPPPGPDRRRLRRPRRRARSASPPTRRPPGGAAGASAPSRTRSSPPTAGTRCSPRRSSPSRPRTDVNVVVLVDFENDSVRTSLEVARALGDRLWGVRLDTSRTLVDRSLWDEMGDFDPRGVNERLVRKVRDALDENGFERVKIVVSGGFDVERIREFEENGVPVDSYGVGSSLIRGDNDFTADIVLTDGLPSAKVGRATARTHGSSSSTRGAFSFPPPLPMEAAGGLARGLLQRPSGDRSHVAAADLPRADRLPHLEVALADAARQADRGRALVEVVRHLGRHRRRRRGRGRAAGGRRLPQRPAPLLEARRARPEGHPPLRAARHRQDAARQGGRARLRRHLLLAERLGVRRDVRRPRRRPHPQALRSRAEERAGDRLHRRARRGRHAPHGLELQPRARPDAEPAPRRARRLRPPRAGRHHRRLEPARGSRPRAPAPRPLRPPGARRRARSRRTRGDPRRPHARQAARRPTSTSPGSPARPRA